MRFVYHCVLVTGLLACAASAAIADQLKSDYDHGVDFSKYYTYSWGTVTTKNPFYADRVRQATDVALRSRGWQLVPSGGDATIFANDSVHNDKELQSTYMGMGGGWGGGWGWGRWGGMGGMGGMGTSTTDTVDVKVGRLVLDFFDSQSKALLWRGSATEDLSSNSDKNSKKLAGDIAKLLKDFPPKKK